MKTASMQEAVFFIQKLFSFYYSSSLNRKPCLCLNLPGWDIADRGLGMCQLNSACDLRDFTGAVITVTDNCFGEVMFSIPSLNPVKELKAPRDCKHVNLKLVLVSSPFAGAGSSVNITTQSYEFAYEDNTMPAVDLKLNCGSAVGDIAIAVIALEFQVYQQGQTLWTTESLWLPAAVIGMGRLK
ncbi:MAG: hypothetical protein ABJA78_06410 [Ferruginibacter sp.]